MSRRGSDNLRAANKLSRKMDWFYFVRRQVSAGASTISDLEVAARDSYKACLVALKHDTIENLAYAHDVKLPNEVR